MRNWSATVIWSLTGRWFAGAEACVVTGGFLFKAGRVGAEVLKGALVVVVAR